MRSGARVRPRRAAMTLLETAVSEFGNLPADGNKAAGRPGDFRHISMAARAEGYSNFVRRGRRP
jgi:hypothetical protein